MPVCLFAAAGMPIKHCSFVSGLMSVCKRPTHLAVVKNKAHYSPDTDEARGNAMADAAARATCRAPSVTNLSSKPPGLIAVHSDT